MDVACPGPLWYPLSRKVFFFFKCFCPLNICALSANTAKTSQDMDVLHF